MKKILAVDDDPHIGDLLEELLRKNGYEVVRAYSGTEAKLILGGERPDLIILDLMLPGLSGLELLPEIKSVPVIVLSALADPDTKVTALLGGAVDYMTKPFDSRELLARVALRLRESGAEGERLLCGKLAVDTRTREVFADGEAVKLTRTEFALLHALMLRPSQVVTKSAILDEIALDTPDCTEQSLKIHISNLRKKLRSAGCGDCIESVWGIGFRLGSGGVSEDG